MPEFILESCSFFWITITILRFQIQNLVLIIRMINFKQKQPSSINSGMKQRKGDGFGTWVPLPSHDHKCSQISVHLWILNCPIRNLQKKLPKSLAGVVNKFHTSNGTISYLQTDYVKMLHPVQFFDVPEFDLFENSVFDNRQLNLYMGTHNI